MSHFIQLPPVWSLQREVSHSLLLLCRWWRDEPRDPSAWLISDHYPISALLSGCCAFVLAFISIASCTTSRLLTWLWNMGMCASQRSGRGCPIFWSEALVLFQRSFLLRETKTKKGSKQGRKEMGSMGDSKGVIRPLSVLLCPSYKVAYSWEKTQLNKVLN